jgi:hypothetical protein
LEGRAYSRLHWLAGEIRILKGLDTLLTIDRARFIEGPEYDEFRDFFRGRLAHFANHVEAIAVANRDIKRKLSGSRAAEVAPTKEVIDRNIERLKSRGFRVITVPKGRGKKKPEPVRVDVRAKTIEVSQEETALRDTIAIAGTEHEIRVTSWPDSERLPAVRRGEDGLIEVNGTYPPFRSRRYGEVLKRVMVLMLLLSEQASSPRALLSGFSSALIREFRDAKED